MILTETIMSSAKTVFSTLVALTLLWPPLLTANAIFVKPPTDLKNKAGAAGVNIRYKEVPADICETTPGVKSYSGYSDLNDEQHVFWWFFERRHAPEDAPTTIWLNGGPGSSSMLGLLSELGPCGIFNNATRYYNPFSWSNASNLLFIDQPVTVGFSYSRPVPAFVDPEFGTRPTQLDSNECPKGINETYCGTYSERTVINTSNSTEEAAPRLWRTLQGFAGAFPQYSRNGYHLATESYGGHYGPVFSNYIVEQDKRDISGAVKLNLKSLLIGNGCMDPTVLYKSYYNFTVSPGNPYVKDIFNATYQDLFYRGLFGPNNCLDQLKACEKFRRDDVCSYAYAFCSSNAFGLYEYATDLDVYDVRQTKDVVFPYKGFNEYLNFPHVQAGVGAFTNFSNSSRFTQTFFIEKGDQARELGIVQKLRNLLAEGIRVTIWAGDADMICNYYGNYETSLLVNYPDFKKAGFMQLITPDRKTHGEVRQSGPFAFARIFEAGHLIPSYQPEAALAVFERTIYGLDIATGKLQAGKSYRTKGKQQMKPPNPTKTLDDIQKGKNATRQVKQMLNPLDDLFPGRVMDHFDQPKF